MSADVAAGAAVLGGESSSAEPLSIHAILIIVLVGGFLLAVGAGGFFFWLSRRRANRHVIPDLTGEGAVHNVTSQDDSGGPKKLQKVAWTTTKSRIVSSSSLSTSSSYSLPARRHRSLPILGHFAKGLTGRLSFVSSLPRISPGQLRSTPSTRHKRNASWIDEDALHGPATSINPEEPAFKGKGKEGVRESWPMHNRSPTLPQLCHSLSSYRPRWQEEINKETMTGPSGAYSTSPDSYTQVVMEARGLPEPPEPATVHSRDRQPGSLPPAARLGHKYSNSEPPMRPKANLNTSPVRSLPRTPSKQRNRQSSTDSTLSEILKSTEKRLQEGYVSSARLPRRSRTSAAPGKSQWFGTSRESLLDHSQQQYGASEPVTGVYRSRSETRPSSPEKGTVSLLENGGHSRQDSQTSTVSSSSTIELGMLSDFTTSGMVRFNRNPGMQEPETQFLGIQSVRSSLSSALSTIQSEDEFAESVKMASSPFSSPSSNSRPNSNNVTETANNNNTQTLDPFSNTPWAPIPHRPAPSHAYPTRTQKSPDLFRESLERSLRTSILRATVDQSTLLAEASKLPPLPALPGGEGKPPHTFFRGDCPGCCKVGQTKTMSVQTCVGGSVPGSSAVELPSPSRGELVAPLGRGGPKGPRTLHTVARPSILNSIVLPPPGAAPNFAGIIMSGQGDKGVVGLSVQVQAPPRREEGGKMGGESRSSSDRDSSPPSPICRTGSRASKIQRRTSVSSSVYSQDPKELPAASIFNTNPYTNKVSFQANSRIDVSSSAVPFQTVLRSTLSSENMKIPKPVVQNTLKEKAAATLEDTENRDTSRPPSSLGFGIASTVAELRRMNSGISIATSVASSDAGGGGYVSDNRPTTPTATARLSGVGNSHRKSRSGGGSDSGRRAYLSLGGTTSTSLQKKRSGGLIVMAGNDSGSPTPRRRSHLASSSSISVPATVMALESGVFSTTTATASGSPIKKRRKTASGHVKSDDHDYMAARESPGQLLGCQPQQHGKYQFDDQVHGGLGEEGRQGGEKENNDNSNSTHPSYTSPSSGTKTGSNLQVNKSPSSTTTPAFRFPPVSPPNFTFEVRPLATRTSISSTNTSNTNNYITAPISTTTTKKHRRHNSSTDHHPPWANRPLTIAKHRTRTPSPPKLSSPLAPPQHQQMTVPPLNLSLKSSSSPPKTPQAQAQAQLYRHPIPPKSPKRQHVAVQSPVVVINDGYGRTETPGSAASKMTRRSSLGLYDQDGFLISNSPARSPVRCR